jgi:hypothetical protein
MRRLGTGVRSVVGRAATKATIARALELADSEVRIHVSGGMRGDLAHRSLTRSSMIGHWYSPGMGRDLQSVNDDEIGM